jgi:hypothetical protein
MLRTSLRSSGGQLLRGACKSARSLSTAAGPRSLNAASRENALSSGRTPNALAAQASQRRTYAMAAEESNKGVVSVFQKSDMLNKVAYLNRIGPERLLPSRQHGKLH